MSDPGTIRHTFVWTVEGARSFDGCLERASTRKYSERTNFVDPDFLLALRVPFVRFDVLGVDRFLSRIATVPPPREIDEVLSEPRASPDRRGARERSLVIALSSVVAGRRRPVLIEEEFGGGKGDVGNNERGALRHD